MLGSEKVAHLLQIGAAGGGGMLAEVMINTPSASQVVTAIQVGAQVLIAVVTAFAAIKKALQKPQVVVANEQ